MMFSAAGAGSALFFLQNPIKPVTADQALDHLEKNSRAG